MVRGWAATLTESRIRERVESPLRPLQRLSSFLKSNFPPRIFYYISRAYVGRLSI